LARLGDVIFGRFHLVDLVCSFLSQAFEDRHFRNCQISCAMPSSPFQRIETEKENDQHEDDWR
jgi:hypothetical protein